MNIRNKEICGYNSSMVRDMFRKYLGGIEAPDIKDHMEISQEKSEELIEKLIAQKYLKPVPNERGWFEPSHNLKYRKLMGATASRPINRKTADKLVKGLIERAKEINNSPNFLDKVTKLIIFGSYWSEEEKINDVDVIAFTDRKIENYEEYSSKVFKLRKKDKKSYRNLTEELYYSYYKTIKYLKNRSTALKVATRITYDSLKKDPQFNPKIVYQLKECKCGKEVDTKFCPYCGRLQDISEL